MRNILVAFSILALGACQGQPAADAPIDNVATENATPAPSESGTGNEAAEMAEYRAVAEEGCIGGGRDRMPDPRVQVEAHCACALDRTLAGMTRADVEKERLDGSYGPKFTAAMRQCIREIPPRV